MTEQQTLTIQEAIDLGVEHHNAGRLPEAENIYNQILQVEPKQHEALNLLGVIASQLGKNDIAVDLIGRALAINPDYAEAYYNLGYVLKEQGKLDDAVASYQKAIAIQSDYADAHYNLGIVFQDQGREDYAVASYHTALAIKPDYVSAHNNLGNAFGRQGKVDDAVASYRMALTIKPDYAEAHFNLHSLLIDPDDMAVSIKCVEKAINVDPSNRYYRFILGMLLDYSGNSKKAVTHFNIVESGVNEDSARLDAWHYIKSVNNIIPLIIGSSIQAFKLGINAAAEEGLVLEFGVGFGTSVHQIAEQVEHMHGFDSFEGLPEAWHKEPKGSYTTKGIIPSVPNNVTLHKGWFEDTLPSFIEQHQEPIRFMNIDCDIYSSTKTILDLLAKQITHGTVIVFDEYIGNANWREDEFKAFQEAVVSYGWEYEYLCFSFMTKQVVVRIN